MYKNLSKVEIQQIDNLRKIIKKYNFSPEDILKLLKIGSAFPVGTSKKLTILESAVKYFLENKKLKPKKLTKILGREKKNILQIYKSASKKHPRRLVTTGKFWIPSAILVDTKLSAQEAVVTFLYDKKNLSYHEIAVLLKRNDRTIWTVYQRGKAKYVI